MDAENFFHGHEHTDFSARCARAGFNHPGHPFDAAGSNDFIGYRFPWAPSQPVLSAAEFTRNGNSEAEVARKKALIATDRVYIPYRTCIRRMV